MDEKLEYFKKKILAHLDDLEQKENAEKKELKKSLLAFEMTSIEKAGYPVGTIREWKGKKYIKVAPGKWRPKYDSNSRGAKMSIAALKRKADKCESSEELLQLILENRDRFSDENGRPLPFVKELSDYISGRNDTIESEKKEEPKNIGFTLDDIHHIGDGKTEVKKVNDMETAKNVIKQIAEKYGATEKGRKELSDFIALNIGGSNPLYDKIYEEFNISYEDLDMDFDACHDLMLNQFLGKNTKKQREQISDSKDRFEDNYRQMIEGEEERFKEDEKNKRGKEIDALVDSKAKEYAEDSFKGTNVEKAVEEYANDSIVKNARKKVNIDTFCSSDENRAFMNGVYYDEGKKVATDGRYMLIEDADYPESYEGKIIVDEKHRRTFEKRYQKEKAKYNSELETAKKTGIGSRLYRELIKQGEPKNPINDKGEIVEERFPNYKRAIPDESKLTDITARFDTGKIEKLAILGKTIKQKILTGKDYAGHKKDGVCLVKVGESYFDAKMLSDIISYAQSKGGLTSVFVNKDSDNAAVFEGNGFKAVLMPVVEGGSKLYFDGESGNLENIREEYKDDERIKDFLDGDADRAKREEKEKVVAQAKESFAYEYKRAPKLSKETASRVMERIPAISDKELEINWKIANLDIDEYAEKHSKNYMHMAATKDKDFGRNLQQVVNIKAAMDYHPEIKDAIEAEMKKRELETEIKKSFLFDEEDLKPKSLDLFGNEIGEFESYDTEDSEDEEETEDEIKKAVADVLNELAQGDK